MRPSPICRSCASPGTRFRTSRTAPGSSQFVRLGNYAALFADKAFTQSVVNNLIYAAGTVPPSKALALLFALALQRSTRFNAVMRALLLFPRWCRWSRRRRCSSSSSCPGVGLFDYYLAKIGLRGLNWLGDPDVALWSLIGITIWKNASYYMLLFYLAGLRDPAGRRARGGDDRRRQRLAAAAPRDRPLLAPTTAFVLVDRADQCPDPGRPR